MSVLSECLGKKHSFTHNGQTYEVSLVTQAIKVAFEEALFCRSKTVARNLRDVLSPAEFAARIEKLNDDFMLGRFSIEGDLGREVLQTKPGCLLLASLLFGLPEMEMIRLMGEARDEVVAIIKLCLQESLPHTPESEIETTEGEVKKKA